MSSDEAFTAQHGRALIIARHNAALIREWAKGMDYAGLGADLMRRYAVERAFILIAEAIKDVPLDLLNATAPHVPWRKITGFRNFLAHTYEDLPDERIMLTINKELPIMMEAIADILERTPL